MAASRPPVFTDAAATLLTATLPPDVGADAALAGAAIALPPGTRIYHRAFAPAPVQAVEHARREVARRRKPVALQGLLWTVRVGDDGARLDAFAVAGEDARENLVGELDSLEFDGLGGMHCYLIHFVVCLTRCVIQARTRSPSPRTSSIHVLRSVHSWHIPVPRARRTVQLLRFPPGPRTVRPCSCLGSLCGNASSSSSTHCGMPSWRMSWTRRRVYPVVHPCIDTRPVSSSPLPLRRLLGASRGTSSPKCKPTHPFPIALYTDTYTTDHSHSATSA
jgi:hypothetical protein